ncbi:MAG: hypothetical protein ACRDQZ_02025 [Mycobacteriales bacterium]
MPHRSILTAVLVLAGSGQVLATAPASPPQFFVVCGSQPNLPTIYYSGMLQGPASALQGFRAGFSEFLLQHYAYKGVVGCVPSNNAANLQTLVNNQTTALRKAKKNVVETSWTESAGATAAAPAAVAAVQNSALRTPATAAAATRQASSPASASPAGSASAAGKGPQSSTGAADGSGGSSQLNGVLGSIFGGSGTSNCGASGASTAKAGSSKSKATTGDSAASGSEGTASAGCPSPFSQLSGTLANVFSSSSSSKTAGGTTTPPKTAQAGGGDGALGSAEANSTKLVVYGCGRQDTQVACVTQLTNENQGDTLVQSDNVWKDTFIVDDRGDRHQRTRGFFLNVDGDQRQQLDISYGKTAQFVLMFDGVQPKVQKVTLRSTTGGLDVEEIGLLAAGGGQKGQQH